MHEVPGGLIGVAGTADEALQLPIAQKPELAIMDIRLGGRRDGIEAAIELQNLTLRPRPSEAPASSASHNP